MLCYRAGMTTILNPYLSFKNEAKAAMAHYLEVFGGDLTSSTFAEFGMAQSPADNDLVMHSQLITANKLVLMASDTPDHMEYKPGTNVAISVSSEDEDELRRYWDGLVAGGATISQPLEKAPWGDTFGMLTDAFGIGWLFNGGTSVL